MCSSLLLHFGAFCGLKRKLGQHQQFAGCESLGKNLNNFLICQSICILLFYHILFYHIKKSLYQLYHTILQYSQHPNFYFTIQHIKIIFLHDKTIYPKIQIKTETQKPKSPLQPPATTTTTKNIPKLIYLQNSVPRLIFISKAQYPK